MQKIKVFLMFMLVIVGMVFFSSSVNADGASQEQCFQILKDNMKESGIFPARVNEIDSWSYADLSLHFSKNYNSLSSFGVDIDKNVFEIRLHSFGRQTGYKNPPLAPFPVSTKSDIWDNPVNEFVIGEEYINGPGNSKYFLDCFFMQISSDDLMKVTRENYLYDGPKTSLMKNSQDGTYKAWYSDNPSFDYQDKPLAAWKKLFIFPKTTQNEYFNKYDIADAYPANRVESFAILDFFKQPMISVPDYDEEAQKTVIKRYVLDKDRKITEASVPKELEPIEKDGINKNFALNEYYQAIEARFPEFAKILSFRGTLKYDTLKELISSEQDPRVLKIVNTLFDGRFLSIYEADKNMKSKDGMVVSDPEMEKLLISVSDADAAIKEIMSKKEARNNNSAVVQKNNEAKNINIYMIGSIFLASLVVIILIIWFKNKS